MSVDHEVQELLREFRQRGLQNLMSNPPASAPCEETLPAPNHLMQTRSTRNKFKAEVHSKQNEERHKPSGKTPEDPEMNPLGSAELPPEDFQDFDEDENIALQHPPYIPLL